MQDRRTLPHDGIFRHDSILLDVAQATTGSEEYPAEGMRLPYERIPNAPKVENEPLNGPIALD